MFTHSSDVLDATDESFKIIAAKINLKVNARNLVIVELRESLVKYNDSDKPNTVPGDYEDDLVTTVEPRPRYISNSQQKRKHRDSLWKCWDGGFGVGWGGGGEWGGL